MPLFLSFADFPKMRPVLSCGIIPRSGKITRFDCVIERRGDDEKGEVSDEPDLTHKRSVELRTAPLE